MTLQKNYRCTGLSFEWCTGIEVWKWINDSAAKYRQFSCCKCDEIPTRFKSSKIPGKIYRMKTICSFKMEYQLSIKYKVLEIHSCFDGWIIICISMYKRLHQNHARNLCIKLILILKSGTRPWLETQTWLSAT